MTELTQIIRYVIITFQKKPFTHKPYLTLGKKNNITLARGCVTDKDWIIHKSWPKFWYDEDEQVYLETDNHKYKNKLLRTINKCVPN